MLAKIDFSVTRDDCNVLLAALKEAENGYLDRLAGGVDYETAKACVYGIDVLERAMENIQEAVEKLKENQFS